MKALLLLLAGCDGVFHLDAVHLAGDAPADVTDVSIDAAMPPPCMSPVDDIETFDEPSRVCPWGFFQSGCDYTIANGAFTMTTREGETGQCGCGAFANIDFGPGGQFIQITAIGGAYEYLFFTLHWVDGRAVTIARADATTLRFTGAAGDDRGDIQFDPIATQWLRMRPDADRSGVIAEYSADAQTWTAIGRDPTPPPAAVKFEFEYGVPMPGETVASTAVLDGINACP